MPWKKADVDKHIKGLTDKQKEVWIKVANSALDRCLKAGGERQKCEASAIRQANAVAKGVKESVNEVQETLQKLEEVGRVVSKENESKIRAAIKALQDILTKLSAGNNVEEAEKQEAIREAKKLIEAELSHGQIRELLRQALHNENPAAKRWYFIRDVFSSYFIYEDEPRDDATGKTKLYKRTYVIDDNGKVMLGDPVEVVKEITYKPVKSQESHRGLAEAKTKTEDGKQYPAEAYAYVPDSEKPSTWKLRLWEDPQKKMTAAQVGRAIAAFSPGGFRGQKVDIPAGDVAKVKAKLRAAWKKVNPDRDPKEMPNHIKEADNKQTLKDEFVPLIEKGVHRDGTIPIKIISPGWGTSGYYSEAVLKRDAGVYKKGTKMYWDHPTKTEESERPERSLRDLAGVLVSDGRYEENGPDGPGVYADAKVFTPYKEALGELAPHIGLSHRALGQAKQGEAEGKTGPIIEKIAVAESVDFVTDAGRGGKVLELFEAAREKAAERSDNEVKWEAITLDEVKRNRPDLVEEMRAEIKAAVYGDKQKLEEAKKMSDEKLKELEEAKSRLEDENKRLKEALILREARDFVSEQLKEAKLPDITKQRLVESLAQKPVLKNDELDKDEYKKKIKEAVDAEVDYLAKVTGSGNIRGMGEGGSGGDVNMEEVEKNLESSFARLGLSESAAKIAAKGRE